MTKEQFDLLSKHGDVVLSSHYVFYFNEDSICFDKNSRIYNEDDIFFELSERLYEVLSKLFNWYAELGMDEFKEEIDIRLAELPGVEGKKMEYLNKKYFDELDKFEQLIKEPPFDGLLKLEELKDCWFLLIENELLLNIINYLKFDVLHSQKIPENFLVNYNFHLYENYFLSDSLKKAYRGMRIEKRIDYIKEIIESFEKPTMPITENDFLLSTIEDFLGDFKDSMTESDYYILIQAIKDYFQKGKFPTIVKKIKVSKTNKKRFGWALNKIYRSQKSDALPIEYLLFAKENISLFTDVEFDKVRFKKTNLYKYFTTKQGINE